MLAVQPLADQCEETRYYLGQRHNFDGVWEYSSREERSSVWRHYPGQHLVGVDDNMHQTMVGVAGPAEDGLVSMDDAVSHGSVPHARSHDGNAPGTCGGDTVNCVGGRPSRFTGVPHLEIPADQCRLWQLPTRTYAPAPVVGSKNTQGRRPRMEDTDAVHDNLLEVPLLFCRGDRVVPKGVEQELMPLWEEALGSPRSPLTRFPSEKSEAEMRLGGPTSGAARKPHRLPAWFHFAGVYDGHGGQMVSREVAQNLHLYFKKAFDYVLAASMPVDSCSSDSSLSDSSHRSPSPVGSLALKRKLSSRPMKVHDAYSNNSSGSDCVLSPVHKTARKGGELKGLSTGSVASRSLVWNRATSNVMREHPGLRLDQVADAVRLAFGYMDRQLLDQEEAQNTGSTAVVAMVSDSHMCIANCGDSRAVLSRSGVAYRLTRDHKPELDDEQERIRRCGGKVLDFNGKRVMGLLAMSRALGDHCLRDVGVVADPEVTILGRSPEDEFLVLASDGLWDALSDCEVCDLARRCFQRAKERGAAPETAARVAASVLMRAALDRGSNDNITVTVVDLRYGVVEGC